MEVGAIMWIKETVTYTQELIDNNPRWKPYFSKSTIGNQYTILRHNDRIIMSDTEYETCTNQPLYDLVQSKVDQNINPNILLVGWGLGFVVPKIKEIAPNADITVIEKYQEVLNLTPPDESINVMVCDVKDAQLYTDFDIIWSDLTETELVAQPSDSEFLKDLLSENGVFKYWIAKCSCPHTDN